MDRDDLAHLLLRACGLAGAVLRSTVRRAASGRRHGQYAFDLDVDGPLIELLTAAGLGVLSEEAGPIEIERELIAVVDPVDGSTNAAHGIPWYATSICVVDGDGPLQSIVMNHATHTRFEARRGGGAIVDGAAMSAPDEPSLESAIVAVNGVPPRDAPWAQFRALGAAALDLCAVAHGTVDGYVDFDDDAHGAWDYLGGMLVCTELGLAVQDAFGRDLVTLDHTARRTPVVGGPIRLGAELLAVRTRPV